MIKFATGIKELQLFGRAWRCVFFLDGMYNGGPSGF